MDWLAATSLVSIWALLFTLMWAHWGDLTIDCGREMYVPAALAKGKVLYRDVWYPYTPGGPYLNSILFRIFSVNLAVLYWAGALSALGTALVLYVIGLKVTSRVAAWTTATVVLVQSFGFTIFCFPLPYSFGAAYACLAACVCIWLVFKACETRGVAWLCSAGIAAAIAMIMKQEIGTGCFIALGLFAALRGLGDRSIRRVGIDLACLLPGIFICLAVIGWMISLKGTEFITHENLTGWPTSYFMKTYGPKWLANTGLALTGKASLSALELLVTVAFWCGLGWILARHGDRPRVFWLGILILAILSAGSPFSSIVQDQVDALFFPPAIVFLIILAIPVAVWSWSRQFSDRSLQMVMLFLLSTLIASRSLFGMKPYGYPIFYDGPVLLSFFAIMNWFLRPKRPGPAGQIPSLQTLPYLGALTAAVLAMGPTYAKVFVAAPLVTSHGTIFARADKVQAYRAVLDFINRHKGRGSSFLSVPEDMSLYFLADIDCPIRLYQFHPGTVEPGRMEGELIQQIDADKVRYVIWSNRKFENYGAPVFGVDFDQALGNYLRAHYTPATYIGFGSERFPAESKLARLIRAHFRERMQEDWKAVIWERVSQAKVLANATGNRSLPVSVGNRSRGL